MQREPYGPSPRQYGEWWVPSGSGAHPLVVLVHGGYWRPAYDLTLEHEVADALRDDGLLVWNLEYAPAGTPWPQTLSDVATGYDHAVRDPRVDPSRVAVVGHSAGGHLALWLASRPEAPVLPALCVPQAPVACLRLAWEQRLGDGAVELFVGGSPTQVPERFDQADPLGRPLQGRCVLLHAPDDETVPMSQSETYARATGAQLREVPGGHFGHLDPASGAVTALREVLTDL